MNIFVTNSKPWEAAKDLDDVRLNKMLIETVQLLSHIFNGPYKLTHKHHPCVAWLFEHNSHVNWLLFYEKALSAEYFKRFYKIHASHIKLIRHLAGKDLTDFYEAGFPTDFCNCSHYKDADNIFDAYKQTLYNKWRDDKIKVKFTLYKKEALNFLDTDLGDLL